MRRPYDTSADWQMRDRMQGKIVRRVRRPADLTPGQKELAEQFMDRWQVSEEHAQKYLDYFYALLKGWISPEQFTQETQLPAPERRGV